jgi:hypothetical protein
MVEKLSPQPGDIIVFRHPYEFSQADQERIASNLFATHPGVAPLFLEHGARADLLRARSAFILLHSANGSEILVNVATISGASPKLVPEAERNSELRLAGDHGGCYYVRETVGEIKALLAKAASVVEAENG